MKRHLLPATAMATFLALVLLVPAIAFGANPTTSGALLTITSSDNSVNLKIYDSQIHTGFPQIVPLNGSNPTVQCTINDQIPTDAYVLQGGSPTGCDPGDDFETSQGTGSALLGNFAISTQYLINGDGVNCTSAGVVPTICASPDTGFLTVMNNGPDFSGTITLSGTSPIAGGLYCPPNGKALDSFNAPLPHGQSVRLALSSDSSNCGGFNQPQEQTLTTKGSAVTFLAGLDTWTLTGANNSGGEVIDFLPIPTNQNLFYPGPLFSGDQCNPYDDFSVGGTAQEGVANGNVCAGFRLSCSGLAADCSTFSYGLSTTYSGPHDFGSPHFLKADGAIGPPANGFDENIFVSYDPGPGDPTPKKNGGGGGTSFFSPTYAGGGTEQFFPVSVPGYPSPFFVINNPPAVNKWEEVVPIPLIWQQFDATTNHVVTKPKFFSGGFCKANITPLSNCPENSVALQFARVNCSTLAPQGTFNRANAVGNAVIFNPFAIPKTPIPANTFNVLAIPSPSFEGTCQVLQLVIIGQGGAQSMHSAFFGPF